MNATISTADVLRPDIVNLDLTARSASEALTEMHGELFRSDAFADSFRFLSELLARHVIAANCLDQEIALPHVRTSAVNRTVLAIGRSKSGVPFGAEHPTVRLIFLIGVPAAATAEYLRLMSRLVRALRSRPLRQALLDAPTAEEFRGIWSHGCQS